MPALRRTAAQAFQCRRRRIQGFWLLSDGQPRRTSPEGDGSKPEKKAADAGKEVAAKANGNGSATSDKATVSSPATAASTAGSSSEGRTQKVGATAR